MTYPDLRHLTGVGFEAKEAAAPYGKGVRKKEGRTSRGD